MDRAVVQLVFLEEVSEVATVNAEESGGVALDAFGFGEGFENDFFLRESEASVERTVRAGPVTQFVGEARRRKSAALLENDGVLDRVLQFADVAGPVISHQLRERFLLDVADGLL